MLALREAAHERACSDRLLLNILPPAIAERLKASPEAIADHSAEVTVLFADLLGFTALSAKKSPLDLVRMLDRIFSEFDALAERHGLEKIKTIGDACMSAAGLPLARTDHAPAAAHMAREMLAAVARIAAGTGEPDGVARIPGAVQCTDTTAQLLRPTFELQDRGPVQIDSKGVMRTYLMDA